MKKSKILKIVLLTGVLSLFAKTAYAGTWYERGCDYSFYTGKPGNRGDEVSGEVIVGSGHYEMKVNGQRIKNQWIYYVNHKYGSAEWSYFDERGHDVGGWQKLEGQWYNFGGGGTMITGWLRTDQQYYHFDPVTGVMQTSGTAVRDGVTYAFGPDGLSEKIDGLKEAKAGDTEGWITEGRKRYYLRDGQKVTNEWLHDGIEKYYVGADGAAYTGTHIIDGYFYWFIGEGRLYQAPGFSCDSGHKVVYEQGGRGTAVEMNAQERLLHSATTCWCGETYELYWKVAQLDYYEQNNPGRTQAHLRQQLGITNKEECLAAIRQLFELGQTAENQTEKSWFYSNAMALCDRGRRAGWWDEAEEMDMQIPMAQVIQQSFSSWDEYNDAYMDKITQMTGGSGETYEKYRRNYDWIKDDGSFYRIDWNEKLEKSW